MEIIACAIIGALIIGFLWWQLYRSNMEIPGGRGAASFASR